MAHLKHLTKQKRCHKIINPCNSFILVCVHKKDKARERWREEAREGDRKGGTDETATFIPSSVHKTSVEYGAMSCIFSDLIHFFNICSVQ